jgi:hypothetical protein
MGYSHYWWRAPELDQEPWNGWVHDVRQIVDNLPARVPQTYYPLDGPPVTVQAPLIVAGPLGEGSPWGNEKFVSFNGGGWADVDGRPQRLWCETFSVDRIVHPQGSEDRDGRGWYFQCCKTRQQPYDLAVTASLIRLAHRFPEGVQVSSDGWPEDWQAGLDLCRKVFGHAELPFAVDSGPAPAATPDRLNELLAKRDGGRLAPHEVGELRDLLDRDLEAGRETSPAGEVEPQSTDRTAGVGREVEP